MIINLTLVSFEIIAASSLSHVSSSSPSSTPTDSESHHSEQILHPAVSESSTQQSFQITDNSVNEEASSDESAPPPPISSRPERTKSIVSLNSFGYEHFQFCPKYIIHRSNIILICIFYSIHDPLTIQI